ncbi:MAG: hypothetical protein HC824_15100 [Synechococcales cyanobacterium RM1_1_8]|nr:hypothetical protein [Synechococcales cyanobacterium RM1_1_8]
MQIWVASFIVFFVLSQFFDWLRQAVFPWPVLVLGGVILAIASNYDKRHSFPFWPSDLAASGSSTPGLSPSPGQAGPARSAEPTPLTATATPAVLPPGAKAPSSPSPTQAGPA